MVNPVEEAVVRKSLRVPFPIERAFSVFVEQMGIWWPPTHHIGAQPFQAIMVEPHAGGRWYERDAQGNECDWGRVLAWGPPHRVTFAWHLQQDWTFSPDPAKASEVDIRFTSEGPSTTLIELTHSAIERHGDGYEEHRTRLDSPGGWSTILAEFAQAMAR